jgi:hypothetical protein
MDQLRAKYGWMDDAQLEEMYSGGARMKGAVLFSNGARFENPNRFYSQLERQERIDPSNVFLDPDPNPNLEGNLTLTLIVVVLWFWFFSRPSSTAACSLVGGRFACVCWVPARTMAPLLCV